MIKSPKMCDMFQKVERKRVCREKLKEFNETAVLTLRQYKFDDNVDQFVD